MKIIKRFAVEFLVVLANTISLLKKMAVGLGSLFVLKPGKSVLRVVFYKFVVKIYSLYYSTARSLGWKGREAKGFRFSRELSHVLIIASVFGLVFFNFVGNSVAEGGLIVGEKNILSDLTVAEFGDQNKTILTEDVVDYEEVANSVKSISNTSHLAYVKAEPRVEKILTPEEEVDVFTENVDDLILKHNNTGNTGNTIPRRETISYVIEDGDTISTIAEKFGIGVSTILWENDLNATSIIRPGDTLRILPISGITHQVAKGESVKSLAAFFGVNEQSILDYNDLGISQSLKIGQKILIPGGKQRQFASTEVKTYSGVNVVRDIADPVRAFIKPKEKTKSPRIGNRMVWPTVGYRITQYYSLSHYAIDVGNHVGTPLYAADAGVIEIAGWGRGYGNTILINHGGGKKTRYGHLSKFYVSRGDVVEKGETIGAMGNTGWSTGPHLHFEVIINGVKYNPLNYVR